MKLGSMIRLLTFSAGVAGLVGCGSSSPSGATGGAVTGAVDMHCGDMKTPVGACITPGSDAGAAIGPDAGANSGGSDFRDPMFNAEGDDDDCKYHVKWTSTPVRRNGDVTFNVTVTKLTDGSPATMADVQIEAFLNPTHPTPSLDITNTESPAGTYQVGPVRFDAMGDWTVRFHFYEMCSDLPDDSPHGHAAFFVRVP